MQRSITPAVLTALISLYLIWGSTYFAMRLVVEGMPPLLSAGIRYTIAGSLMFVFLKIRGAAWPSAVQWRDAGIIGALLLLGGNGAVALALDQGVSSGMSALVVAIAPLFALIFASLWGQAVQGRDWVGIALGFCGVLLLNTGSELAASPIGAVLLIAAALVWAFGSMWGKRLQQPPAFMASAVQMLVGGVVLVLAGGLHGETMTTMPSAQSLWALAYLIFFGSILGFSSYVYLLATVRPALATSYAYVNPVVAVAIGVWLGGEQVETLELVGMTIILAGVVLVCWPSGRQQSDS
ncbi:MAG TPA: drug/metabolite exporter YedA [Moraxellaceae bacterium]|jgi:drug/metabolite transporter (DMT)-like permease|nr:drug/metabolite exporter YedA [Moraxellaceae bacterium]HQV41746.1 drug/metabolite exporter YedA [Moraxellaceae bacterium]HQX89381.1 drug/metabolite exporter YedA [Moraxellaceae bacterium]